MPARYPNIFHALPRCAARIYVLFSFQTADSQASHIGITFNEKADSLANEASCTNVSTNILVPFSDFSHSFKKQAKTETERQNILEFKGKRFFKSYYHPSAKPWFSCRKLPRDFTYWTNRLRADHMQLAASLFKINLALDTKCQCGSLVQYLNHII